MAYNRGAGATRHFIPELFSAKVAAKLDEVTVAVDCVNRSWEDEVANVGDQVTIPVVGDLSWSDYTVDSSITYSLTTENSVTFTLDQADYCAYRIDDVDQHQSVIDVMNAYGERMAISGRDLVDTFLLTDIATKVPVTNTLGAATIGSVISVDPDTYYHVLVDLFDRLRESKAHSATNQRPWLIQPTRMTSLMKKSNYFTHATDMGDEVIRNGVIGMCAGFEVKETTNMTQTAATGGNDDYFEILAGYNLGYTFAMQINQNEEIRLENYIGDGRRGLMIYGGEGVVTGALAKAYVKL